MRPSLAGLALLALAACAPKPPEPSSADIRAARTAALEFDRHMNQDIIARLDRSEDPVSVWLSYADHVPGWGKAISDTAQFEFSRTALGVRNPADAPDDWEQRQLQQMSFMLDAGVDPETLEVAEIVTEGDETALRWMKPILMTETCLACHGEALDPRIRQLIGQEYPLDEAAGYSGGQLGGAYSVRKPLSVAGKAPPPYRPAPAPEQLPADPPQPGDAPPVVPRPAAPH